MGLTFSCCKLLECLIDISREIYNDMVLGRLLCMHHVGAVVITQRLHVAGCTSMKINVTPMDIIIFVLLHA